MSIMAPCRIIVAPRQEHQRFGCIPADGLPTENLSALARVRLAALAQLSLGSDSALVTFTANELHFAGPGPCYGVWARMTLPTVTKLMELGTRAGATAFARRLRRFFGELTDADYDVASGARVFKRFLHAASVSALIERPGNLRANWGWLNAVLPGQAGHTIDFGIVNEEEAEPVLMTLPNEHVLVTVEQFDAHSFPAPGQPKKV